MNAKEAVKYAKDYVEDLFGDEKITNLGLEEIEKQGNLWKVTVGFSRPWNTVRNPFTTVAGDTAPRRAYRVVSLRDPNGEVESVKRRDIPE